MKRALLVAAFGVGLGAMALTRGGLPLAPPPPPSRTPPPVASARVAPLPPLLRSPFEFAPRRAEPAPRLAPPSSLARVSAPNEAPPSPIRLVGFVHRGDGVRAVLIVEGETVLLAPGESAAGYAVVALDEVEGVRLTAPDGSEVGLTVPE